MPVIDPVSGFKIPEAWMDLAGPDAFLKIKSGLWVLLSDGRMLKRGLTTGTTAAAACKGAVLSLAMDIKEVDVMTPAGIRVTLPVNARVGICSAFKDSGDHQFDVTDGMEISAWARATGIRAAGIRAAGAIVADAVLDKSTKSACTGPSKPAKETHSQPISEGEISEKLSNTAVAEAKTAGTIVSGTKDVETRAGETRAAWAIELKAGKGIGRISRSGLDTPKGRAAISRFAEKQIMGAIKEGLAEAGIEGIVVELCVPQGEEIAKKTLNPALGIEGGISILGSTGFVEPWNEHLAESRADELVGIAKVLATTGRTGLKYSRILFPEHKVVLIGSRLDMLRFGGDQDSILCGLPALILKWAWPQVLDGTAYNTVAEMVEKEPNHPHIEVALSKAKARLPFTRIVLLRRDGRIFRDLQ